MVSWGCLRVVWSCLGGVWGFYLSHSTVKIHIHSNSDTLYADGLLEIREHGFIF